MKIKFLLVYLISFIFSKEPNNLRKGTIQIHLSNEGITTSDESVEISGTEISIKKSGTYLVDGSINEANIIIKESSVDLLLQDVYLPSRITAPITIEKNLKNIKIKNVKNTTLYDLEDFSTTKGECAVIKIKKNSIVKIENKEEFNLIGTCKNIIKGGNEVSIIFEKSDGEYKIQAKNNTAIASDGYLEFNGGKFTINSEGDAIKSSPEIGDEKNLGKILIKSGTFIIRCKNDAFTATNNITIIDGIFDIQTENGYDSKTFDKEIDSAKGFKLKNNATGHEFKIYGGNFNLNTADDAFHSESDLKVINGNYTIYSGDDGFHAGLNLVLGKKNGNLNDLTIKVFYSYEALEGMTVTIYSGRINVTAKDDGLNAAGGNSGDRPGPGPGPGPGPRPPRNDSDDDWPPFPPRNDSDDDWPPFPPRNDSDDDWPPFPPGGRGNASYYISIYGGEIYVFCDGDGLDSNGNIFIHGGDLNVFSQGNRDNEPIDHDGNFTLFDGIVLGVGSRGIEKIHDGIKKGNELYAYYSGDIKKNKILKIKDKNKNVVKQGNITKDINYIFFSSLNLNKDYKFYLYDENNTEVLLNITFGKPPAGKDDDDRHDDSNSQTFLKERILCILLLLILF